VPKNLFTPVTKYNCYCIDCQDSRSSAVQNFSTR